MAGQHCRKEKTVGTVMNDRKKSKVIGVRADGNSKIGMGHLMRCLSIAGALREEGFEVVFFTSDEAGEAFVVERGFACKATGISYDRKEEERELLQGLLRHYEVALLLVDSYQVNERYMEGLKEICPVFYLDDMGTHTFPVSGLINYNIYGEDLSYEDKYNRETVLLLGAKYAPVREDFRNTPYKIRETVQTVLITMGGSDQFNIAGQLCENLLSKLPAKIGVKVICGRFNPHLEGLKLMAEREPRLTVLSDVKDMWNVFADTDIAVAAAGSTMYELATMGVPAVSCYYVENQRQIAEGFANRCDVINAGDYSADKEKVLEKLSQCVLLLAEDYDKRQNLSRSMKKITDGKGANYLAREIKKYMEN